MITIMHAYIESSSTQIIVSRKYSTIYRCRKKSILCAAHIPDNLSSARHSTWQYYRTHCHLQTPKRTHLGVYLAIGMRYYCRPPHFRQPWRVSDYRLGILYSATAGAWYSADPGCYALCVWSRHWANSDGEAHNNLPLRIQYHQCAWNMTQTIVQFAVLVRSRRAKCKWATHNGYDRVSLFFSDITSFSRETVRLNLCLSSTPDCSSCVADSAFRDCIRVIGTGDKRPHSVENRKTNYQSLDMQFIESVKTDDQVQ